ncbi:M56 family metallopeptidase [Listeria cossartiae]|uniref:M56 family metallopeptidase n=1 Tax=Listeria cossartiae TaxID=2838249 RepID=UPI001E4C4415|nr:M56 family metallopeptidase [Listeria cossartiae]MCD2224462.1 M56 family metallopeptidase [Listeria cossartiae]MCD2239476.1 M56 family metallopeptidase [Listeria cossartiae]
MNELFKIILSMALTSVVLIPLVWIVGKVFNRYLSKAKIYYSWLTVFFFLAVPFSFFFYLTAKDSEFMWRNKTGFDGVTSIVMDQNGVVLQRDFKITFWITVLDYLWLIWLVVFLFIFIYRIASYRNFKKYVFSGAQKVEDLAQLDILAGIIDELGIKKSVELMINPLISSPIFLGLRKNVIVIPDKSFLEEELHYIFRHELVHCKRKDMYYVWGMQLFACVYWFNPLVYLMNKRIQKDRELACDEAVLAALPESKHIGYGDTLLSSLAKSGNYKESYVAVSLHENTKALKERLGFIANYRTKAKSGKVIFLMFLMVLCAVGVFFSAFQAEIFTLEKEKGITFEQKK